jgi:uncharacterized protein
MSTWIVRPDEGRALAVAAGQSVRIINTHGGQVVDTWAVVPPDAAEHLSMEHTRVHLSRLVPRVGDNLYSNERRALLSFTEDTSPGVHDTLMAACDPERYRLLDAGPDHPNCAENFRRALRAVGITSATVPAPLNLFMNIPWSRDGSLDFQPSPAQPGAYVTLAAVVDVVVIVSACPMDINPINNHRPSDVTLELLT